MFVSVAYLEGQGDLVSRIKRGTSRLTVWAIWVIILKSSYPWLSLKRTKTSQVLNATA